MLDSKGIPSFYDASASKAKVDPSGKASPEASTGQTRPTAPALSPMQALTASRGDYSTFQFKGQTTQAELTGQSPLAAQPKAPPSIPPGLSPSALVQTMNQNVERLAGQVMSFFYGNRREKPSAEEQKRRELNDFFSVDMLGEDKVEASAKGQMEQEP